MAKEKLNMSNIRAVTPIFNILISECYVPQKSKVYAEYRLAIGQICSAFKEQRLVFFPTFLFTLSMIVHQSGIVFYSKVFSNAQKTHMLC